MHEQNLTALAILLAAAVALGLIMNRVRMPAAAGFILVGLGLGPSGLGLIRSDTSIQTMAELGVLMLLFIIGMEMRLSSFARALPLFELMGKNITHAQCCRFPPARSPSR